MITPAVAPRRASWPTSGPRWAADRVHTGPTELDLYRRDASNMEGAPPVVCFPTSTAEVQACVQAARRHGVPFVARGSGTGLAGGAVPARRRRS